MCSNFELNAMCQYSRDVETGKKCDVMVFIFSGNILIIQESVPRLEYEMKLCSPQMSTHLTHKNAW